MNEVTLCNDALARLCGRSIMSLDDETEEARLCKRHFVTSVREVLRDGVWRCARRRVRLSPLAEEPAFGWGSQFQLPPDFVRLVELNERRVGMADCPLYEIEGLRLLMNKRSEWGWVGAFLGFGVDARLVYVRDITQPGEPGMAQMEPLLSRACSLALARKLVFPMQMNERYASLLDQEYQAALRDARSANTRDGFAPPVPGVCARGGW
jgi:hypothetical protein